MELIVNIKRQTLFCIENGEIQKEYSISTAKNGVGEINGSECTPRGRHIIRAKIGEAAKLNSVFVGRRLTGEIFSDELKKTYPDRDWILTRILWLSGLQPGVNRLGNVDTMRRYIYIHGCPDSDVLGRPSSHGCVKMRNKDVVELFNTVLVGTPVEIKED